GAQRLRDLHRERADASGCPIDQNLLPRTDLAVVAKALGCRERRDRSGGRVLVRDVRRLGHEGGFRRACVLRQRPATHPETVVPGLEWSASVPHGLDAPRHVPAGTVPGPADAEEQPDDWRPALHQVPVERIERHRPDADQDLAIPGRRSVHVLEMERTGIAVAVTDDGFHLRGIPETRGRSSYLEAHLTRTIRPARTWPPLSNRTR